MADLPPYSAVHPHKNKGSMIPIKGFDAYDWIVCGIPRRAKGKTAERGSCQGRIDFYARCKTALHQERGVQRYATSRTTPKGDVSIDIGVTIRCPFYLFSHLSGISSIMRDNHIKCHRGARTGLPYTPLLQSQILHPYCASEVSCCREPAWPQSAKWHRLTLQLPLPLKLQRQPDGASYRFPLTLSTRLVLHQTDWSTQRLHL